LVVADPAVAHHARLQMGQHGMSVAGDKRPGPIERVEDCEAMRRPGGSNDSRRLMAAS
jgi:hypothetical protein